MGRCETCKWWDRADWSKCIGDPAWGSCELTDMFGVDAVYPESLALSVASGEESVVFTAPTFGCVQYVAR